MSCEVYSAPGGPGNPATENAPLSSADGYVDGDWYYMTCTYDDTGDLARSDYWQFAEGEAAPAGPDLEAMARQAYDEVPLAYPVPATSPGIDVDQVTGLPTWLWLDPASFSEQSARAEIPGFWVEVTAHPERVVWDMGDGSTVVCDGQGTPYDPTVDDDAQSTDCSHLYQHTSLGQPDERYPVSVTVEWSVDWTSSTGDGGTLAPASRTTEFGLRVTELQAVVTVDS